VAGAVSSFEREWTWPDTSARLTVPVDDAEGAYFIPVVVGLGAARGMLAREELAHGRFRAFRESIRGSLLFAFLAHT
jgi:hypothetical protein